MVARFSAGLTTILSATYFGGSGSGTIKVAPHLAISPLSCDVYIAGNTNSTDLNTTTTAVQPALSGATAAFVVRFAAALSTTLPAWPVVSSTRSRAVLSTAFLSG